MIDTDSCGAMIGKDIRRQGMFDPCSQAFNIRQAPAQHDHFRIKNINHHGKAAGNPIHQLIDHLMRLVIAGKARTLKDGAEIAQKAIDDGAAKATLAKLVDVSNRG